MKTRLLIVLALLVLPCASAEAQVTLNPTRVEFSASPDHSATFGGSAIVTSYRLVYKDGATTVHTQDAGKPTPAAGVVSVTIPAQVSAIKNTELTVTVETVGPGGTVASAASDPFGQVGPPRVAGKPSAKP